MLAPVVVRRLQCKKSGTVGPSLAKQLFKQPPGIFHGAGRIETSLQSRLKALDSMNVTQHTHAHQIDRLVNYAPTTTR